MAYRSVRSDICVGLLNEGLPRNDVKPAKLFPNDFEIFLHRVEGVPIIMIDQEEHASVSDVSYCPQRADRESYFISGRPKSQLRNCYFESCINGDSGSPRFMLVGDELVLVSMAWRRDGAGRGDCYGVFLAYYIDDIQRNMDALKPGSSIETIDLSGFQVEILR